MYELHACNKMASCLTMVDHPSGLLPSESGGLHADSHVSQDERDGLMVGDWHTEGLPLQRVLSGLVQRTVGKTGSTSAYLYIKKRFTI